jgi:DNA-binding CsgD family transcriptional regulator
MVSGMVTDGMETRSVTATAVDRQADRAPDRASPRKAGAAGPRKGSAASGTARRDSLVLGLFLGFEVLAAVFFVGEAWDEFMSDPRDSQSWIEVGVAVALVLAILVGAWALRRTLQRMRAQEAALQAASGALSDVIAAQFTEWRLTPAERDVGMLALKGLDVAEIAEARKAAQGTVRAQLTSIYAKAGVSGRAQFAAFFVEDLLGGGV